MKDSIDQRFKELLSTGDKLVVSIPWDENGPQYWTPDNRLPEYQQWISSTANLITFISSPTSPFIAECQRLMGDQDKKIGIPSRLVQKLFGLLKATQEEWDRGLLRKIEYLFIAEAFDDFLDHASFYHKGNKKIESSVLSSAVLEDTVKKIAKKNSIETKGLSLEPLIDELTKANIFTPVKGKRVKGYASVRNHALHAEWDDFDIRDVGGLIDGTRELIDEFL